MSPVRVILHVSAQHGPSLGGGTPRNRYRAAILRNEEPVAEMSFELAADSVESSFQEFATVLGTLDLREAGQYRMQLDETAEPQMQVTRAAVEVRRNAREPDMRVVWTGVAMLAAAAGLLFAR
jgi:hypothetical protein